MENPNEQDGLALSTAPQSQGRYLGDPAVVNRLVRDFAQRVLELRSRWHESGGAADPTEHIEALCRSYGDIFLGRDKSYVAQPFNAPNRLGVVMRLLVKPGPEFDDPGVAFFNWFALQVLHAAVELEGGTAEDYVKRELDAVTRDVVGRLLGTGGAK